MVYQVIFKDLMDGEPNYSFGILLDNGDVICGCCGGVFESNEMGTTWDLVQVFDTWVDLTERFSDITRMVEHEDRKENLNERNDKSNV